MAYETRQSDGKFWIVRNGIQLVSFKNQKKAEEGANRLSKMSEPQAQAYLDIMVDRMQEKEMQF